MNGDDRLSMNIWYCPDSVKLTNYRQLQPPFHIVHSFIHIHLYYIMAMPMHPYYTITLTHNLPSIIDFTTTERNIITAYYTKGFPFKVKVFSSDTMQSSTLMGKSNKIFKMFRNDHLVYSYTLQHITVSINITSWWMLMGFTEF